MGERLVGGDDLEEHMPLFLDASRWEITRHVPLD